MYSKLTEEKISNLVSMSPTPYPFCIAWSTVFLLINFISLWHEPYTYTNYMYMNMTLFILIISMTAWCRRILNIDPQIQPFFQSLIFMMESYEKYGYINMNLYRQFTLSEFYYNDRSQLYEFTYLVKLNYMTGFQSFLWSEFMIFFSLIWAYCHNAFSPSIWHGALWPPVYLTYFNWKGGPQYMTILLLSTSAFMNWADFTLRTKYNSIYTVSILVTLLTMGCHFIELQIWEYSISTMSWKDSIYSCTFYAVTAMHGLHVIMGMMFIFITVLRLLFDPYMSIEGLISRKLIKNNLKKLFNIHIMMLKKMQLISGSHLLNSFIIKKNFKFNNMLLNSLFPNFFLPSFFIIQNTPIFILFFKNLINLLSMKYLLKSILLFEKGFKWGFGLALWFMTIFPGLIKIYYYKLKKFLIKSQLMLKKHLKKTQFDILKVWENFIYDCTEVFIKFFFVDKSLKRFMSSSLINNEFYYMKLVMKFVMPFNLIDEIQYYMLKFLINYYLKSKMTSKLYFYKYFYMKLSTLPVQLMLLKHKYNKLDNILKKKTTLKMFYQLVIISIDFMFYKLLLNSSNKYQISLISNNTFNYYLLNNSYNNSYNMLYHNLLNTFNFNYFKHYFMNYFLFKYVVMKNLNLMFYYSSFYLMNNWNNCKWSYLNILLQNYIFMFFPKLYYSTKNKSYYIIINMMIFNIIYYYYYYMTSIYWFMLFQIILYIISYSTFFNLLYYITLYLWLMKMNLFQTLTSYYFMNTNMMVYYNYNNLLFNSHILSQVKNLVVTPDNINVWMLMMLLMLTWNIYIMGCLNMSWWLYAKFYTEAYHMYESVYMLYYQYKVFFYYIKYLLIYFPNFMQLYSSKSMMYYYNNIVLKTLMINYTFYSNFMKYYFNLMNGLNYWYILFFFYWFLVLMFLKKNNIEMSYFFLNLSNIYSKNMLLLTHKNLSWMIMHLMLNNLYNTMLKYLQLLIMMFIKMWNIIAYKLFYMMMYKNLKMKYFYKWNWYRLKFSNCEWFIFFKVSAWYWHFVDAIWIMVYTICYIM